MECKLFSPKVSIADNVEEGGSVEGGCKVMVGKQRDEGGSRVRRRQFAV